jgi:hypothetical protein
MKDERIVLRIKRLMQYFQLNQTEMAAKIGINQSNFSGTLSGKRPCGNGIIDKVIISFPEINREWLLYGEGEMLKSTPGVQQHNVNGNNNYVIGNNNNVQCALPATVDIECPRCGEVIEVPDAAVLPLIPEEVAKKPDVNLEYWRHAYPQEMEEVDLRQIWGKGVFLLRVDTRAMEPEYREGTFLVLRKLPDISYARADGSAYVVDTMRPHTLFRYLAKERDGSYTLTADNDRRGPIYLKAEDIISVYDIVGSFRIGR